jgi:NAD-dependent deacetylase
MKIDPHAYRNIVFFTGAGMSAESGVPTYRGSGGIWHQYNWEEYACQEAFDRDPAKVLSFHEVRRTLILSCMPHAGHAAIAALEKRHPGVTVVTQNIDGMHQRAGAVKVIELHGSIWRTTCPLHGTKEDIGEKYHNRQCPQCDRWLRPDVTWFGDMLNQAVVERATKAIAESNIFISVGTSGVVWPAAGYPHTAKNNGALCIEINPEANEMSSLYDHNIREPAGAALPDLFL